MEDKTPRRRTKREAAEPRRPKVVAEPPRPQPAPDEPEPMEDEPPVIQPVLVVQTQPTMPVAIAEPPQRVRRPPEPEPVEVFQPQPEEPAFDQQPWDVAVELSGWGNRGSGDEPG